MKIIPIVVLVLFSLLASTDLSAKETVTDVSEIRLQEAWAAYKSVLETYPDRTIPVAKKLYEAGINFYNKDDINLAMIAYRYALALNSRFPNPRSIPLLEQAIEIYKKSGEISNNHLLRSLLELGRVYYSNWNKRVKGGSLLSEALALSKKDDNEILIAETKLKIGIVYLSYGRLTAKTLKKAKYYIESAHTTFEEAENSKQIEAGFWSGKVNLLSKKKETAAKIFESTIKKATESKIDQYYAMTSRAFLVETYSKLGEEELATKYCQEIGKNQVWQDDIEPVPLYRTVPVYPKALRYNEKDGVVTVEFIIDIEGNAKNIKVIESKGSSKFGSATIRAMKKWRYAPKYENGKPVEATAQFTMGYNIVD